MIEGNVRCWGREFMEKNYKRRKSEIRIGKYKGGRWQMPENWFQRREWHNKDKGDQNKQRQ